MGIDRPVDLLIAGPFDQSLKATKCTIPQDWFATRDQRLLSAPHCVACTTIACHRLSTEILMQDWEQRRHLLQGQVLALEIVIVALRLSKFSGYLQIIT